MFKNSKEFSLPKPKFTVFHNPDFFEFFSSLINADFIGSKLSILFVYPYSIISFANWPSFAPISITKSMS